MTYASTVSCPDKEMINYSDSNDFAKNLGISLNSIKEIDFKILVSITIDACFFTFFLKDSSFVDFDITSFVLSTLNPTIFLDEFLFFTVLYRRPSLYGNGRSHQKKIW